VLGGKSRGILGVKVSVACRDMDDMADMRGGTGVKIAQLIPDQNAGGEIEIQGVYSHGQHTGVWLAPTMIGDPVERRHGLGMRTAGGYEIERFWPYPETGNDFVMNGAEGCPIVIAPANSRLIGDETNRPAPRAGRCDQLRRADEDADILDTMQIIDFLDDDAVTVEKKAGAPLGRILALVPVDLAHRTFRRRHEPPLTIP